MVILGPTAVGKSRIAVRVENANSSVRVSVADSGPGILPADAERIFEKFFRVERGAAALSARARRASATRTAARATAS